MNKCTRRHSAASVMTMKTCRHDHSPLWTGRVEEDTVSLSLATSNTVLEHGLYGIGRDRREENRLKYCFPIEI